MEIRELNFGDIDAKNEILKEMRSQTNNFYDTFSIPSNVNIDDFFNGSKYFIKGLKGCGKTALIRYLYLTAKNLENYSEIVLFKSDVSEDDRQSLSKASGYSIITTGEKSTFTQDFKESWKWLIHQKIGQAIQSLNINDEFAKKYCKITLEQETLISKSLGALFSSIKSGKISLGSESAGAAIELGLEFDNKSETSISDLNRICSILLNKINYTKKIFIFFDELELFHETKDQLDRDRRIIRDLLYAVSNINADSAENLRPIFICATIRSEVLHSILELGHEISKDIDDYGINLDWSNSPTSPSHPLMNLIGRKMAKSASCEEDQVWGRFLPEKIKGDPYYAYILHSSYYRPRDIVRLLRVARDQDPTSTKYTNTHFEKSLTAYSTETWLEITEELLAIYSAPEISSIEKLFLGFTDRFFLSELEERVIKKYRNDSNMQSLIKYHGLTKILNDLYRIGVVGNDFYSNGKSRQRWIFRANATLNEDERMSIHRSLHKHLSIIKRPTSNARRGR